MNSNVPSVPGEGDALAGRELGWATLGIVLGGVLLLVSTGSLELFSHPLWLDEFHSVWVATLPTVGESLGALSLGADFNPPLLHLLLKPLTLGGSISPTELRVFSFLSVSLALVLVYGLLRHDLGRIPSIAGMLAVWSHPIVIQHAFEGRYYGPMLLFTALLAYSVRNHSGPSLLGQALLAIASIALCTIHYFGVFAWILVIGSSAWLQRRGRFFRNLWPSLAGPVALIACAPIYLGQKGALTASTWVPNPSFPQVWGLFDFFLGWLPVTAVLFLGAARLIARSNNTERGSGTRRGIAASLTLISLAAYPIFLVLFSILIQPSIVMRYAIVTTLAFAPVVAIVLEREGRWVQIPIIVLFVLVGVRELRAEANRAVGFRVDVQAQAEAVLESVPASAELVVPRRHDLYPLVAQLGSTGPRLVMPFLQRGTLQRVYADPSEERWVRMALVEQDVALVHKSVFGVPNVEDEGSLSQRDTLFLAIWGGPTEVNEYAAGFFPDHLVEPVRPEVVRLVRRD